MTKRRLRGARSPGEVPMTPPAPTPSNIDPSLTCDDAPAAIGWLCRASGLERRLVVPGADGTVRHSELGFGPGVVTIGSAQPDQGRAGRQNRSAAPSMLCDQVDDTDAHCARAQAAGATIFQPSRDEDRGSRGSMAKDAAGHRCSFGTYRPGA
jgi:uncharacterized glyoxalase superfamily protein PhnB